MTIRLVNWEEFIGICRSGFRWTAYIVAGLVVVIAATHFAPKVLAWSDHSDRAQAIHDVEVYNSAIQGYMEHRIPAFTRRDQRFMQFARWMANTRTKDERERAYLSLLGGRDGVPHFAPDSVKEALNRPDLSTEARVRALAQDYGVPKGEQIRVSPSRPVGAATYAHLRGDHRHRGYPTGALPVRNFNGAIKWEILLAAILIYASMAYSFLSEGGVERTWEGDKFKEKSWALPANPGGWLIMALYAPSFLFLWGFRILIWIPGGYLVRGGQWFFTEADFRNIRPYIQARRTRKERGLKEGARMAQIGQDVLKRELELSQARTIAEQISNPAERQSILEKITRAEGQLTAVKKARLRDWETLSSTPKKPDAPKADFDDLFAAVDALAEAEEVAPKS